MPGQLGYCGSPSCAASLIPVSEGWVSLLRDQTETQLNLITPLKKFNQFLHDSSFSFFFFPFFLGQKYFPLGSLHINVYF